MEFNLVNSGKFTITDRRQLDQIIREQNFQISGEVSDEAAVSIGHMLGANIIIIGEITVIGSIQRLMIKAIDVQSARILAMIREEL